MTDGSGRRVTLNIRFTGSARAIMGLGVHLIECQGKYLKNGRLQLKVSINQGRWNRGGF